MNVSRSLVVNVVSGKGGAGKSMICAVLGRMLAQQGARVLLLDFDIFVRGLTYFFYKYRTERRLLSEGPAIADLLGQTVRRKSSAELKIHELTQTMSQRLSVGERFFEAELIPAVRRIDEIVPYTHDYGGMANAARTLINGLSETPVYDIILIDNRSGIDELVIVSSELASLTLSVSEADPIAQLTNEHLLRTLKEADVGKVYTLLNKVRSVRSLDDYEAATQNIQTDFNIVGQIPFDLDTFQEFGNPSFWDSANNSKFAFGLADAWNHFAHREGVGPTINMKRFSISRLWFEPQFLIKRATYLRRFETMALIGGMVAIFGYFAYNSFWLRRLELSDIILVYGLLLLMVPILWRLFRQ